MRGNWRKRYAESIKAGLGIDEANMKLYLESLDDPKYYLQENEKVKLNIHAIQADTDYDKKTDEYKKYIQKNAEKIFTVAIEEKFSRKNSDGNVVANIVSFKEDKNDLKWLWHIKDLIKIEEIPVS